MTQEFVRLRSRLEDTFKRYGRLPEDDLELRADFAKYLCVLLSGYVEKALAEILLEHARRERRPRLERFIESSLREFRTANSDRIGTLLGRFDPEWKSQLDRLLVDEIKESINSVVGIRNQIAHGAQAPITFHQLRDHFTNIERMIDTISRICLPPQRGRG